MRERASGPGPGEVNNASPRKNQIFLLPHAYDTKFFIYLFIPYNLFVPSMYHLCTICVPYKPPIPSAYHLCAIYVWYKPSRPSVYGTNFFLIFFHHLRMIQFIRTIYVPSVYHTNPLYHLHMVQNFFEFFYNLVKK